MKTVQFDFSELQTITAWVQQLLAVCRMAQVVISIEFMSELRKADLPSVPIRFDAYVIILSHNMRMVGFTYAFEKRSHRSLALYFKDDLGRYPRDAIIHASQILDQMALAISSDITLGGEIEEVGVGLVESGERIYAEAKVKVDQALRWLDRKLTLENYTDQVQFRFSPGTEL